MVLCVISLLTIYMAFLHLLDPWITKRRQTAYKQHAEEEVGQLFLPRTIILEFSLALRNIILGI